jgi:hypothetical protein
MNPIQIKIIRNKSLPPNTQQQIIDLHQQYFDLPGESIIEFMLARDEIHLFFDRNSKKLVGTVGIQWFNFKDFAVMYEGGIVVSQQYLKYGLLAQSLIRSSTKTFLRYFYKKRYLFSLVTTPEAYRYYIKFGEYWPKINEPIPENIHPVMQTFCQNFCGTNFSYRNGIYLTAIQKCEFSLNPLLVQRINRKTDKHTRFFLNAIPNFSKGEQLIVTSPMTRTYFKSVYEAYLKTVKRKKIFKIIPIQALKSKSLYYLGLSSLIATLGLTTLAIID